VSVADTVEILFEVADTGIGMHEEELQAMLDALSVNSVKMPIIGLDSGKISDSIIKLMNGKLRAINT
jgi:HSP90 family molecular chaperone